MIRLLMLAAVAAIDWACNDSHLEGPRDASTLNDVGGPNDMSIESKYDQAQSTDLTQPDLTQSYCDQYKGPCSDGIANFKAVCELKRDKPAEYQQLSVSVTVNANPSRYKTGIQFYFQPGRCPANPNDIANPANKVLSFDQPLPMQMNGDVQFYINNGGLRMRDPKYTGLNCFVIGWKTDCMDSICLPATTKEVICP